MKINPETLAQKLPEIYYDESNRKFYVREAALYQQKRGSQNFTFLRQHLLKYLIIQKCNLNKRGVSEIVYWLQSNRRVTEARSDRKLEPGIHEINLNPV